MVVDRLADVARAMGDDTAGIGTEEAADAAIAAVPAFRDVKIQDVRGLGRKANLEQLACDAMADTFPGNRRPGKPTTTRWWALPQVLS